MSAIKEVTVNAKAAEMLGLNWTKSRNVWNKECIFTTVITPKEPNMDRTTIHGYFDLFRQAESRDAIVQYLGDKHGVHIYPINNSTGTIWSWHIGKLNMPHQKSCPTYAKAIGAAVVAMSRSRP